MFGLIFLPRPTHLLSPFPSTRLPTPWVYSPTRASSSLRADGIHAQVRLCCAASCHFAPHPPVSLHNPSYYRSVSENQYDTQSVDSGVDPPGFSLGSSPSAGMWCEGKCKGKRRGWVLPVGNKGETFPLPYLPLLSELLSLSLSNACHSFSWLNKAPASLRAQECFLKNQGVER